MNRIIAEHLIGKDYTEEQAPTVLDEFANTAGAGSIIAFHRHHKGFNPGEYGVLCSFGAGYSMGCIILEKL
jgi:beta-ketodecanoyl-[acyl-carrier-protein] synthase